MADGLLASRDVPEMPVKRQPTRHFRVVSLVIAGALILATSTEAHASPITIDVASLVWTLEGVDCTESTPENCLSVFTLNYLWLDGGNAGPSPAPAEVSAALLTSLGNDTLVAPAASSFATSFPGIAASASGTVSFDFLGPQSIGPLSFADGFGDLFEDNGTPTLLGIAVPYQFEYEDDTPVPVPEPSTMGLLALGLIAVRRRLRR